MSEKKQVGRQLPEWIEEHIALYVNSNGEQGHIWNGVPTLLLTTTGRNTGNPVMLPLIYGKSGDLHIVVGSRGGHEKHPHWYLNLVAQPMVQVQVGTDRFVAKARDATAEERPGFWQLMSSIWPAYDEYQQKTDREIPLIVLETV